MLEKHERSVTYCSFCPNLCLHACPVSNGERRNSVSPWSKMSIARWVREGIAPLRPEVAGIFYKCTGCLGCQSACLHNVDTPSALFDARASAVEAGVSPYPASLFRRDPAGMERDSLPFRSEGRDAADARVVFVPGCDVLREDPEEVRATILVLRSLGLDAALGPAKCCGYPLHAGGFRNEFKEMAELFARELTGRDLVVVGPGTCTHALTELYAQAGVTVPARVRPLVALIADRIGPRPFPMADGPVAVHDGCHHARRQGLAPAVRRILERVTGHPPIELRWSGEGTWCCGAAGGYERTSPLGAAASAGVVLSMLRDSGAKTLVTFDPSCRVHLQRSLPDALVMSGVKLLAQALGALP